jgi:galactokinase
MQLPSKTMLEKVYGESQNSSKRFEDLARYFTVHFKSEQMKFFSSPGERKS